MQYNKLERELQFLHDYENECKFLILMATNSWGILEESYHMDYIAEYLKIIKHDTAHSRLYVLIMGDLTQKLIREGYIKSVGVMFGENCMSLTIRGCWYIHTHLTGQSLGLLLDHFYMAHGAICKFDWMNERLNLGLVEYFGKELVDKCVRYGREHGIE